MPDENQKPDAPQSSEGRPETQVNLARARAMMHGVVATAVRCRIGPGDVTQAMAESFAAIIVARGVSTVEDAEPYITLFAEAVRECVLPGATARDAAIAALMSRMKES